jgi:hypothetical protein
MAKLHQFFNDTGYTPDDYRRWCEGDREDAVCGWMEWRGYGDATAPEDFVPFLDAIAESIGLT